MSKKFHRLFAIREEIRRSAGMALLVPMTISGCLLTPQIVAAQEAKDETAHQGDASSPNPLLDELLSSDELEPAAEAPQSEAQPDAAAPVLPGTNPANDEALPTIAVEQKAAPVPKLHEPPSHPQIEEVVVTATKREENVREIPASITALSGADLEQRGAQDASDIVKLIPGVNVTSTGDSPQRVTIRGISSDIGTSATTGILLGNVSFTDSYSPMVALDPNPFDMATVEALKGPQGTLFGASALNGALRYVPTAPRFGEYEVKWFGQYTWIHEGDSAPIYGAAVNLPLYSDELALRVMAFDRITPGFIDNTRIPSKDTNRTDQQGARGLLGWRPNDNWDLLLTTQWQETQFRDVGIADNNEGRLESGDRSRLSPNHTEYTLADLTVTWSGDSVQFVSDTSWAGKQGRNFFEASSRTLGTGAIPLVAQTYHGESTTIGQELRLLSIDDPENPWKWVTGLFAWQQDLKNTLVVPLNVELQPLATLIDLLGLDGLGSLFTDTGAPIVAESSGDVRVRELAAFGELTRRVGSDVEIALGGRLYHTTSGGTNHQAGIVVVANQGSSPYDLKAEIKETGFNPKASVLWHLNDDILAYGLVSKGFRVGGVQTGLVGSTASAPDVFKSDTLWNYEAGIRTQFLDNTLRLDLTGFWVDWKDPQTLQPENSGLTVYLDNVGGVRSRGADLSLQYISPWGVMLTSAVTYADTVTTTDYTTSTGSVVPAGSNWPLAPKWQTASSLSFSAPLGSWVLGASATYTTIGSTVGTFNMPEIFGYQQVDLQFNVANERFKWLPQMALILNNLTDERGLTNAFTSGVPPGGLAAEEYYYITPRSVTVRLMGHFGE